MTTTLITGGARSGKSRFAQELALKAGGDVLFVATAEAGDREMKKRIEAHRRARPSAWVTLEVTTNIGRQIIQNIGTAQTVVIDCITLLVSNVFQHGQLKSVKTDSLEKEVMAGINELVACIKEVKADFIIVTNEVGLGIVPANRTGRLYRDLLGRANQALARHADEVVMMVAGIPVKIKPQ